jgi:hypothetical protein
MVENNGNFWLFYSANSWGTPNYAIGVARCASLTGPCSKPLHGPWLASEAGSQGPGGPEFFQVGGLVWMVHHALAQGQSGNEAQRRIHVDLIAFDPPQVPHVAPPAVSAALAELFLYYDDPRLPATPQAAFVKVMRTVPGISSTQTPARLLGDGRYVCTGLGQQRNPTAMDAALEKRGLNAFQGYTLGMFASEYLCPADSLEALKDIQGLLNVGA